MRLKLLHIVAVVLPSMLASGLAVTAQQLTSRPISFLLDGRQWVVTPAGLTLTAFALPQSSR